MLWLDTSLLSTAVMFLTGVTLALLADLCGLAAGQFRPGPVMRRRKGPRVLSLWDVLLWVIATPLVFAASLVSNRGELRLYVFLGLALGLAVYVVLARAFVVTVITAVRETAVVAARRVGAWLGAPLRVAWRLAGRAVRAVAEWATAGIKRRPRE